MLSESRKCVVHLLDGNKLEIHLQPKLLSCDLLDIVSSHFNLKEKEYFGICYFDNRDNRCWLRPDKKALDHNFQKTTPIQLYFSVRLFVPSVLVLKDKVTVELFYLQARNLIFKGDIDCDSETVFLLASYVLQATHGDYVSDAIALEDLKNKDVMPVKTLEDHPTSVYREQNILENYQKLEGISKQDAILRYLEIVEKLPMYGIHYYSVKDKSQVPWKIGLSYRGVTVYDFNDRTATKKKYLWTHMENIYYRDKKFSMEYSETERTGPVRRISTSSRTGLSRINSIRRSISQKMKLYSYYCSASSTCREIWCMAVSLHKFFLNAKPLNKNLLAPLSIDHKTRKISRSSNSLNSMRSGHSMNDNISESASFYFSLDGDSITSSQILIAEQDMLYALHTRKAFLEQQLLEKTELLNDLCLREAELMGVSPNDLPGLPTHHSIPIRRKIGTAFEFDDSILNPSLNIEDHELDLLERDYEIQKQITHAAQRLARNTSANKSVRKAREASYQKSLVKLKTMEQQLHYLKREAAKETFEGLSKLTRKDDGGSQGDSLGPIDAETSSSKSQDSIADLVRRTSLFTRRPRESMYLAAPVINTTSTPLDTLTYLKDHHRKSPTNLSVISPRYDADTDSYLEYADNFDNENVCPSGYRTVSFRNSRRVYNKPPVKIKSQFHNSSGQINKLLSPERGDRKSKYLCDEFENTGIYNHVPEKEHFSSNPSIPNSFSSPGIVQFTKETFSSPNTLRRLQELSLSPTHRISTSKKGRSNVLMPAQSVSSLTSSEGSESDDFWSDIISEETLV